MHWNCGQLAIALRTLSDAPPLIAAMERFGPLYMAAVSRRWCWRMGVESRDPDSDAKLVGTCEASMTETKIQPDAFFHHYRGGRNATGDLAVALAEYTPIADTDPYWSDDQPQSLLIEEVEEIWSHIDRDDNWQPLAEKVAAIRRMGAAYGPAPAPAGLC